VIPVAVHGAEGRMGILISDLVSGADDCDLAARITEPGKGRDGLIGQDDMAAKLPAGCVVIDFSLAPALDGLLEAGRVLKAPLVIGTTGFTEAQEEKLAAYAGDFPVVRASNFSIGIPALGMLLKLLARTLPGEFDAEQVETHHVTKLDKPSGTARSLASEFEAVRGGDPVPTHSQRLGGVIGEHTWTFSDREETLVLTHRAHSRQAFLRGVLPSVRFVHGHAPGMYGLTDVLQELGNRDSR
jgi:4-hydroxy-tetrahydrodipicolinate reductase